MMFNEPVTWTASTPSPFSSLPLPFPLSLFLSPPRLAEAKDQKAPVQGYLAYTNPLPPYDPTQWLCLGPYGGPRGGASLIRNTPPPVGPYSSPVPRGLW